MSDNTIDSLQIEITNNSASATQGLNALTASLERLKTATRGGVGLAAVGNQLRKINESLNTMQAPGAKISELVSALRPLESLGKTNLNSTINSLKKLPEITAQLTKIDMKAFATQIDRVVKALKPLATEMNKIAAGFSVFPSRIQKLITQNEKLTASNSRVTKSYGVMGTGISSVQAKMGVYYILVRQMANVVAEWIVESNAYVENLNLFTVAMGKHAKEALNYANQVQAIMGIDSAQWIRNQGIFMQIASGFGVMEEKAYKLSEGLTQISYDISSFFNIPIAEAFLKVQSGISGELEPLRRLGYALDVATLQQVAYANGITMSVNKMTQAQKSELRYIAILQQSDNVRGDMARTLITPANALRILNQLLVQLKRALGDMIIPVLIEVIPYVQAFVRVLTDAARALSLLFGFELPTIDYSGMDTLSGGAAEASDSLDGAAAAAKKLKNVTTGFDELNILSRPDAGGAGGAAGGIGAGGDLGLELQSYDFLAKVNERLEGLKQQIKDLLPYVLGVAAGFAAWKVGNAVLALLTTGVASSQLGKIATGIWNIAKAFWGMAAGSAAAQSAMMFMTGGGALFTLGLIAGTVAIIVARFADLYQNSELFRTGLQRVGEIAEGAFKVIGNVLSDIGTAIGKLIPESILEKISNFFESFEGGWVDIGITALGVALLFIPGGQIFGVILLAFEAITLGLRGLGAVSEETWEEIKRSCAETWEGTKKNTIELWEDIKKPFLAETWKKLLADTKKGITSKWDEILNWWQTSIVTWWDKDVAPWFTVAKWMTLVDGAKVGITNKWNETVTWWKSALSTWWTNNVAPWFSYSKWMGGVSGIKDSIVATFKNALESARTLFNKFIDWLNTKMKFSWDAVKIAGETIVSAGRIQLFKITKIPAMFENGGFPAMGQLFVARESGPEMVGSVGGRTAVVNNEQIVESVSRGVYEAVKSAIGSIGGDLTVVVKVGEETLTERVIKNVNRKSRITGETVILT